MYHTPNYVVRILVYIGVFWGTISAACSAESNTDFESSSGATPFLGGCNFLSAKCLDDSLSGGKGKFQIRLIHCCRESDDACTHEAFQPRKPGEKADEGRGEINITHIGERQRPHILPTTHLYNVHLPTFLLFWQDGRTTSTQTRSESQRDF